MGFLDLLSGPLGALFGGASAIAQQVINLKLEDKKLEQLKETHSHELALRDKDLAAQQAEAASTLQLHQTDADAAQAVKELDTFAGSFALDKASYGDSKIGHVVDAVRGLTRPVITAASMVLIGYQTLAAFDPTSPLSPSDRIVILDAAQFIAGTAITWWFGARYASGRGKK